MPLTKIIYILTEFHKKSNQFSKNFEKLKSFRILNFILFRFYFILYMYYIHNKHIIHIVLS